MSCLYGLEPLHHLVLTLVGPVVSKMDENSNWPCALKAPSAAHAV
jgi:hypothetical protein